MWPDTVSCALCYEAVTVALELPALTDGKLRPRDIKLNNSKLRSAGQQLVHQNLIYNTQKLERLSLLFEQNMQQLLESRFSKGVQQQEDGCNIIFTVPPGSMDPAVTMLFSCYMVPMLGLQSYSSFSSYQGVGWGRGGPDVESDIWRMRVFQRENWVNRS